MTEYQRNLVRMWNSLRTTGIGEKSCVGVKCDKCPFNDTVCIDNRGSSLFNMVTAIEIVNQWAKEHPIMTMKNKYKEVFGVEPKNEYEILVCPHIVGFVNVKCDTGGCMKCTDKFWNSEYQEVIKWEQ